MNEIIKAQDRVKCHNTMTSTEKDEKLCDSLPYNNSKIKGVKSGKRRGRPRKNSNNVCSICGHQAPNLNLLTTHLQSEHSKVKLFGCPSCHALFSHKSNLQMHLKIHDPVRPYSCKECDFTAVQKNNLLVHQRTHTKEKPYECNECDFKSAQLGNLRGHFDRKHARQDMPVRRVTYTVTFVQCNYCDFICKKQSDLNIHVDMHHESEVEKRSDAQFKKK